MNEPLIWHGYSKPPSKIIAENTGFDGTLNSIQSKQNLKFPESINFSCCFPLFFWFFFLLVNLTPTYNHQYNRPYIHGAWFDTKFYLKSIKFCWTSAGYEGAKYAINNRKYPLEMQIEKEMSKGNSAGDTGTIKQITISYFFMENKRKNHYLDALVKALSSIRQPKSSVELHHPFPLDWLVCPFYSEFYCEIGSLLSSTSSAAASSSLSSALTRALFPSGHSIDNNRLHIFQTDVIIPIGCEQMNEFRALCSLKSIALFEETPKSNGFHNDVMVRLNRYTGRRRSARIQAK